MTADNDCSYEIKRLLLFGRNAMTNQGIKKQQYHFAGKGLYSQAMFFFPPSSHVWMWELDQKECRALKIWCFQTVVLEKALESPFDSKEIKPVSLKGNQPWIFIGRINAEAPVLWPPDAKSWLIRNEPDLGKDWGQDKTRLIDRTGTNAWVFLKRGLNFFLLGHCGLEN